MFLGAGHIAGFSLLYFTSASHQLNPTIWTSKTVHPIRVIHGGEKQEGKGEGRLGVNRLRISNASLGIVSLTCNIDSPYL